MRLSNEVNGTMFDWAIFLKIIIAVIQAIFQNLPPM